MNRFLLILVVFALSSCRESAKYQEWYENTKILKQELENKTSLDIHSPDDFLLLKKYFSQVKDLSVELSLNDTLRENIAQYLMPSSVEKFCSELLVNDSLYDEIDKKCRKNGHYICSQDVEGYIRFLNGIVEKLDVKTKEAWKLSESCPSNLEE